MTPATGTALIVLVAFVLPGFVVVLFQERTFKQAEELTPFDRLLRTAYYSVWCYLLLSVVALVFGVDRASVEHLYHRHRADPAQLVWRGALAVMAPATVVWLWTLLLHESGLSRSATERAHLNARHQEPTAWDYWFRKGLKSHLRIVYNDGRSVWGFYGEHSFASYAKDGRDLFLEHIYRERTITTTATPRTPPDPGSERRTRQTAGDGSASRAPSASRSTISRMAKPPPKPDRSPRGGRGPGQAGAPPPDQPTPGEASDATRAATSTEEGLNEP